MRRYGKSLRDGIFRPNTRRAAEFLLLLDEFLLSVSLIIINPQMKF